MSVPRFSFAASALLASVAPVLGQGDQINCFERIASYGVIGGNAEIVSPSADGHTLAFSDARGGRVGFVDIRDPRRPVALPDVVTGGEPTSVSFAGDYVVAAVLSTAPATGQPAPDPRDPANAGKLFVIDASDPAAPSVLGSVAIGYHPDSVKLVERDGVLVAVVCIENEPIVVDENELVLPLELPGFPTSGAKFPQDRSLPGLIQVVTIDLADVAASHVADVALPAADLARAGMWFVDDPQPEFVDVFGDTAAVSLQENNGIAVVDISDPKAPSLTRVFSDGQRRGVRLRPDQRRPGRLQPGLPELDRHLGPGRHRRQRQPHHRRPASARRHRVQPRRRPDLQRRRGRAGLHRRPRLEQPPAAGRRRLRRLPPARGDRGHLRPVPRGPQRQPRYRGRGHRHRVLRRPQVRLRHQRARLVRRRLRHPQPAPPALRPAAPDGHRPRGHRDDPGPRPDDHGRRGVGHADDLRGPPRPAGRPPAAAARDPAARGRLLGSLVRAPR